METRTKIGIIAAILFLILLLSACAPAKVVTQYQDRYITKTEWRVDSVWRDRVHTEYVKGDTVYVRDSVWRDRWRTDVRVDTVQVRDSIPYPVEVTKEVRVRSAYDKFTARGFWLLLSAILLALIIYYCKRRGWLDLLLRAIRIGLKL